MPTNKKLGKDLGTVADLAKSSAGGLQPVHTAVAARPWTRMPGSASRLRQLRERRQVSQEDRYLSDLYTAKRMPAPPSHELPLKPFYNGLDVVRDLGLSAQAENAVANTIDRAAREARTEVDMRKAIAGWRNDFPGMEPSLRRELAQRTLALFREKRAQQGDFVVKSNMNPHVPLETLLKGFDPRKKSQVKGKMAKPGEAAERASPGRPQAGDRGKPGFKPDDGGEAINGGGKGGDEGKYTAPSTTLDDGGLEDVPEDEDHIVSKLQALHKELLEISQMHAETDAQKHMHNEIVEMMRDVRAKPTPDGLREVLHMVHHFAEMAQGVGDAPPAELDENGEEVKSPMMGGEPPGKGGPPMSPDEKMKAMKKSLVLDLGLTNVVMVNASGATLYPKTEAGVLTRFGGSDFDALLKAGGHKYIKRFRGPRGKWVYVYAEDGKRGRSKQQAEAVAATSPRAEAEAVRHVGTTETEVQAWHEKGTPTKRHWVDSAPGAPSFESGGTFAKYGGDPKTRKVTDPARMKLHESIIDRFHKDVEAPKGQKHAVVMMGGPASGKSSATRNMDLSGFVHVDPDAVKDMLPEMQIGTNLGRAKDGTVISARDTAAIVHEESSNVAKQVRDKAIADGKHVLVDGTGKNADKHGELIKHLQSQGYNVHLVMAHQTADNAHTLNKARSTTGGRYVPDAVLNEAYGKIPHNFEKIAAMADQATMFDASRGFPPKKVWSVDGGQHTHHDEDFVQSFKKEYGGAT